MNANRWIAALLIGLAVGGTTLPTSAQSVADIIFTGIERALIQEYYGSVGLPGGSSVGRGLPPGLQRQLERTGSLPPGLQTQALPYELIGLLPRRDDRFEILRINNEILLVERATRLILDIIRLSG